MSEILATLTPSVPRRWFAVAVLTVLGLLLFYISVVTPPATLGWRLFLVAMGAVAIWGAERVWRATATRLELTREVLRDAAGQELARVEDVVAVERGAFAFKPSNGFLVRTRSPGPRVWAPGLYWRVGRRVGVGGVTPGAEAKYMAEALSVLIAERDGQI